MSITIMIFFWIFSGKTNDKTSKKNYFGAISGPFCPNLIKSGFSWENKPLSFFNILNIYHRAINQKKLMTHSWENCWTDGQTGDWWQRFYRTLCRMESNNVKGIQTLQKRIKLFEYSKSSVTPNGLIFLKDTHSSMSNEKKWEDKFNGKLFFSHIKTNSCRVLICYHGTKKFEIIIKKNNVTNLDEFSYLI